jgi:hypothetical protein
MVHARSVCSATHLTTPPSPDPLYGFRTPPGLVSDLAESPDCAVFSDAFADSENLDITSALDPDQATILTVNGKPFDTASDDECTKGRLLRYPIDLNGDKTMDAVEVTETTDGEGLTSESYSWRDGASGQDHRIDTDYLGVTYDLGGIDGGVSFVNVNGHIYLYYTIADWPFLTKFETEWGARDDTTFFGFTRRVYAMQTDGTAKVVCQWSPRKRPEEFM